MSKIVAAAAVRGSHAFVKEADELLTAAIAEKGPDCTIEFPETAFYFPMAYALLGEEVKNLGDAQRVLEYTKTLLSNEPSDSIWLPYLSSALDAGIASLLGQEIIEGVRYLNGAEPQDGWHGFISDTILRTLGIQLVDGRLPG
ncbi:MAG: CO dehydrogenase/CO-methylating acetyl-CoA synthase complex subunit beta, partial [Armatimonadetes bacterium]|nr:CO dehydrogenase/CO-methylating acetyl-CoA synthase complex subunit beta [Armatimonadota bacterium]NIM23572.1 CO dehydrogenase/CO-methylating acetyl-CoA synthase complex subunit beta [Armatimonadota bacterium]NIM67438.1 CO dehydrogenase/CO-methylating acetyl-CoA synthase complex subunit beta [Armatimonadota bacterium]NIM75939.1 CO dehydrogenase/CO-methylating acetyl-CoA synthase complex subunit beta [Armatimonadota bacterium]NIN05624.1 CO dehydrogenase/CO-methylating acetyl-CoA synthase comp